MSLLIVASLQDEVRLLLQELAVDNKTYLHPALLWKGILEQREISLLVSGVGEERMREAMEKTFALEKPGRVLHVGYAGSATPLLGMGQMLVAESVVKEATGQEIKTDPHLLKKGGLLGDRVGRLLTVQKPIEEPLEKAALGTQHSCLAVDMESFACLSVCEKHNIPALAARSIFDALEMQLPPFETRKELGEPKAGDVLRGVFEDPKTLLKMPEWDYAARKARHRLTQFVEDWLKND